MMPMTQVHMLMAHRYMPMTQVHAPIAVKQEKKGASNTHTLRMLSVKESWCAAQCNRLAVAINLGVRKL